MILNNSPFLKIRWFKFDKGRAIDYTKTSIQIPQFEKDKNGWIETPMVKPEGDPIRYYTNWENDVVYLGNWWSIQFRFYQLLIRFRYRSWTTNIFYVTWGGF